MRVPSFFAQTTHQTAARRYEGGWVSKKAEAAAFFFSTEAYGSSRRSRLCS